MSAPSFMPAPASTMRNSSPPIAADHIFSAEVVSEGGSDHLKDSITGVVAEGVIEILEMVNINHDCADRHAVARGAGIFFFKATRSKTPVKNGHPGYVKKIRSFVI